MNRFMLNCAAIIVFPAALFTPAASASGGSDSGPVYSSFTERAVQTRLGGIEKRLPSNQQTAPLESCYVTVEHSRQLLANLEQYLQAKPSGAEINNIYLMQKIRDEFEC